MEFHFYTETLYTNEARVVSFNTLKQFKKFASNLAIETNELIHFYYFVGKYERSYTIEPSGILTNFKKRDYTV